MLLSKKLKNLVEKTQEELLTYDNTRWGGVGWLLASPVSSALPENRQTRGEIPNTLIPYLAPHEGTEAVLHTSLWSCLVWNRTWILDLIRFFIHKSKHFSKQTATLNISLPVFGQINLKTNFPGDGKSSKDPPWTGASLSWTGGKI